MAKRPPGLRRRLLRRRRRLMFLCARSLMRVFGFSRARSLGALIGELQFRLAWRESRRCAQHMAALLGRPVHDSATRAQLREAYHVNTAAVLEVLALFDRPLDADTLAPQCEIEGLERLQAALAGGRGAILLGAHMGNGVLLAIRLAQLGLPVSVVYRQSRMMSADLFEHGFARYGIEGILANEGLRAYGRMLGAVRKGRVVFLMIDQGVRSVKDGPVLRFLGKDLPMPAGPAQLARQSQAPVLPLATLAARPAWRFRIEAPLVRTPGAGLEADVEAMVRATERQVLEHPQLWSWHHRRWRKHPLAASASTGVSA